MNLMYIELLYDAAKHHHAALSAGCQAQLLWLTW